MKRVFDFTNQTLRGKSVYRILFNWLVYKHCRNVSGLVLDLASGKGSSYRRYLPANAKITFSDLKTSETTLNFNEKFPSADNTFDAVLFFNAIYISKTPLFTLKEIFRVLKKGGGLYLCSPFIANEMPDPSDFGRFTAEGLQRELERAGFQDIKIERFGERFSSAAYLLHPLLLFNFIRLFVNGPALILDKFIPKKISRKYPTPLGYFVICRKP